MSISVWASAWVKAQLWLAGSTQRHLLNTEWVSEVSAELIHARAQSRSVIHLRITSKSEFIS
jgi:hypothetical protein